MINRINLILRAKNITARQFAEEIGIQPSGMSHILGGRNNPSLDFAIKVLRRYPEIDPGWLLLGRGEMWGQGARQLSLDVAPDAQNEASPLPAAKSDPTAPLPAAESVDQSPTASLPAAESVAQSPTAPPPAAVSMTQPGTMPHLPETLPHGEVTPLQETLPHGEGTPLQETQPPHGEGVRLHPELPPTHAGMPPTSDGIPVGTQGTPASTLFSAAASVDTFRLQEQPSLANPSPHTGGIIHGTSTTKPCVQSVLLLYSDGTFRTFQPALP